MGASGARLVGMVVTQGSSGREPRVEAEAPLDPWMRLSWDCRLREHTESVAGKVGSVRSLEGGSTLCLPLSVANGCVVHQQATTDA